MKIIVFLASIIFIQQGLLLGIEEPIFDIYDLQNSKNIIDNKANITTDDSKIVALGNNFYCYLGMGSSVWKIEYNNQKRTIKNFNLDKQITINNGCRLKRIGLQVIAQNTYAPTNLISTENTPLKNIFIQSWSFGADYQIIDYKDRLLFSLGLLSYYVSSELYYNNNGKELYNEFKKRYIAGNASLMYIISDHIYSSVHYIQILNQKNTIINSISFNIGIYSRFQLPEFRGAN